MPGLPATVERPLPWYGRPRSVRKPSAKVRCFLPEFRPQSECLLLLVGLRPGLCRACRLPSAEVSCGWEDYSLSSAGSDAWV